jgi:hypothetical protein
VRKVWISGLCACILAGCVSLPDFRQSSPTRVAIVEGRYLPLATCTMNHIEGMQSEDRVQYQFLDMAAAKTARILGIARVPGGLFYTVPEPVFELAFVSGDDGKVSIESRNGYGGHLVEPRVWPVVERCAGTKITVIPPLK